MSEKKKQNILNLSSSEVKLIRKTKMTIRTRIFRNLKDIVTVHIGTGQYSKE